MKSFRCPVLVVLFLFAASLNAQSDTVREIVTQQRAEAQPRMLLVPAFSLAGEDYSELFLVSKIIDPLPIDIFATNAAGERIYLGNHLLPPSRGLTLDLRQLLGESADRFPRGWLRLDYSGDTQTLQAWSVIRSGKQAFEVPFLSQEKLAPNEYYSFWDVALPGLSRGARAEFTVMNDSATPVTVTATFSRGTRATRVETFELAPQASRTLDATAGEASQRGWLRVTHTGPAGSIAAAGVYRNAAMLAYIPVVPAADTQKGPKFEILRVPVDRAGSAGAHTAITLFNAADEPQTVIVDAVRAANGVRVGSTSVRLAPREVTTLDLRALAAGAGTSVVELPDGPRRQQGIRTSAGLRLRIAGTHPGLMIDGLAAVRSGEMLDMSVHAFTSAHKSGTYPIPDLTTHDVRTTIVNLSDEPSKIVGQYFWDGGTYAVPMFEVPPHGTVTLEPKKLAAAGTPDAAGRKLDANGANLALKWLVRSGSHELLGRTESTLVGQSDGFGFNCGGCCWSDPRLEFNPFEDIELGIGDYPTWEPWTYFDTCTGEVGPYFSNVIDSGIPSPFSWDFANLSTSAGADDDIGFKAEEEAVNHVGCLISVRRVWKWGRGKACDKVNNPNNYNKSVPCVNQTGSCPQCIGCCLALYNTAICKGGSLALATSERNACEGRCLGEMQGC